MPLTFSYVGRKQEAYLKCKQLYALMRKSKDSDIYFDYIEACTLCHPPNYKEVERIIRKTKHYDPLKVLEFLRKSDFSDT